MLFNNKKNFLKKKYYFILLNKLRKKGIIWLIRKITIRIFRECSWLILLPIAIILHLSGFKKLPIRVEHIGHLTTEIDTLMKAQMLGLISKDRRHFILAPKEITSNLHLLNYWKAHVNVTIITNCIACHILNILTYRFFMIDSSSNYLVKHFGTQPIYYINQLWEKRAPLLKLNTEDENWSEIAFNELGIQNKWYICIHVREGGFLPHNEEIQSHRNATIENMHLAIKEITDRGGLVVRMGDPSMTRLFPKLGVIDYAHHALKSDRLDVILCAKAKFFLGCTSGLAFLSMVFGVPIAHANMIPIETLGIRYCDLSIPKLLINNVNNEYLNFSEIFRSKLAGYFYTNQYKEANITYLENTPDEILNLTKEMLDRLENKFIETDEGIDLHQKYMNFFKMGHYSYGAISKVNIAFLKKYQHLI